MIYFKWFLRIVLFIIFLPALIVLIAGQAFIYLVAACVILGEWIFDSVYR